MSRLVLVLDCGATNVRAVAVDQQGRLVHMEAIKNRILIQDRQKHWLNWDTEKIWESLLLCTKKTVAACGSDRFVAIIATSFSDDGAPVDENGNLLYPVISWRCRRTEKIAAEIGNRIPNKDLFEITGEQNLHQHTLFKLLWLNEIQPDVLNTCHRYLMFPGILNFRLTGRMVDDPTTADSTLLLDIRKRIYSNNLLQHFQLKQNLFAPLQEPGTVIGELTDTVRHQIGLKNTIPVITGGHDTQFAICGSGCKPGEAVLSSGTWEILFTRDTECHTSEKARLSGVKNECDADSGLYNTGLQWIGSGLIEWLLSSIFGFASADEQSYRLMIEAGKKIAPGGSNLYVVPSFLKTPNSGNISGTGGLTYGFTMETKREELFRALLEGLSYRLRASLEILSSICKRSFSFLHLVGGGSRNSLWNQIRADMLGIPLKISNQAENTVIGAALFAFIGAGVFKDYNQAFTGFKFPYSLIEPSAEKNRYGELYEKYCFLEENSQYLNRL